MNTQAQQDFTKYFEDWIFQLKKHFGSLLKLSGDEFPDPTQYVALIHEVINHYDNYYTAKLSAATEHLQACSSPSLINLATQFLQLWIPDWNPSISFRIIYALSSLKSTNKFFMHPTEEQMKKIEALKLEVQDDEKKKDEFMARLPLTTTLICVVIQVAKNKGKLNPNQAERFFVLAKKLTVNWLEDLMKVADGVRLKTLKGLLEILCSEECFDKKCIKFLAAHSLFMLMIWIHGKSRNFA